MHFVFVTLGYHPDRTGGAYRYVAEIAERLAARGSRVEVIYPGRSSGEPDAEERRGVHLRRYPDGAGFFIGNWRRETAAARARWESLAQGARTPPLTVLCHAYFEPLLRARPRPVIFLFTGPWAEEYRFSREAVCRSRAARWKDYWVALALRRVERQALRRVERILTISRYYQTHLPRWHPPRLPPIAMISGGVDGERFRPLPDRQGLRASLEISPSHFLFVAVRRLDPRMGLPAMIDAFAQATAEYPQARLWIAGQGPQRPELEERIARRGLDGRVRLLGFVPEAELPRILCAADCTLMPSLDLEGFGLATVESLACGTPVLGSRAGATPELLEPLDAGLLFEAGSVDLLAAKLRRVLAEPAALPAREECRAYALGRFSWDAPVAALERCYEDSRAR